MPTPTEPMTTYHGPIFDKPDSELTPAEMRQIIDALHGQMDNEILARKA
jgi:hypothetical protein